MPKSVFSNKAIENMPLKTQAYSILRITLALCTLLIISACDIGDADEPSETANEADSRVSPAVTLNFPAPDSNFQQNAVITITASASDSDGSIAKVDFYDNGTLIGTDSTSPYSFDWSDASVGSHEIHAVATDNEGLTAESALHLISVETDPLVDNTGTLMTYPVTQDMKNKLQSNRFTVRVSQNGSSDDSFVYQSNNDSDPVWSGALDYMQSANHWTTFSFDGSVDIEVRRRDGKAIESCIIRPLDLNIETMTEDNSCYFTLDQPATISVEIDEANQVTGRINQIGAITKHIVKHPLFIFANPLEIDPPNPTDPGVIYFEPGTHEIGKRYRIPNHTELYIAGGAYVIGTFATANNPQNITIRGRGILSSLGLTESSSEQTQWTNHSIDFSKGSGSALSIEGITITDPLRSCIISYSPVHIQNVKLLSWSHRNDGITAGNDSLIENNFIKVQDDNIKLYFSNQVVRHNVIWQQTSGAVFKFAWRLKRVAQNNHIYDIDIIHSDVFNDYTAAEPDRPDMHSTSAVFSAMGFNKNAAFQNNTFDDIRIEEQNLLRLLSLRMVSTHRSPAGTTVWGDPDVTASKRIYNISFNNIQLAKAPYKPSTLYGNAGGTINELNFFNLTVDNAVVPDAASLSSRIDGIGLLIDGDTSNIIFSY
jgi:hypothetical protein